MSKIFMGFRDVIQVNFSVSKLNLQEMADGLG